MCSQGALSDLACRCLLHQFQVMGIQSSPDHIVKEIVRLTIDPAQLLSERLEEYIMVTHADISWSYDSLSSNPNLTLDFVIRYPEKCW